MSAPHVPGATEIEAASGRYVDLWAPRPEQVCLEDVAHGLSMTCRFGGQCRRFYSVAQHAVVVADKLVDEGHPELALAGLHHDDAEAYLGDLPRPLKRALDDAGVLSWRETEQAMEWAIWTTLADLGPPHPLWRAADYHHELVKGADAWALLSEARELLPSGGRTWTDGGRIEDWALNVPWPVGLPQPFLTWPPVTARRLWLQRHRALIGRARAAA